MLSRPFGKGFGKSNQKAAKNYGQGKLIDISAGGAQVAIDSEHKSNFKKWQFIELRFTPLPYENPLTLQAQIRNIMPTADEKNICLGLQIVGLERNMESEQVLSRLVGIVEQYYQINQAGARNRDIQQPLRSY